MRAPTLYKLTEATQLQDQKLYPKLIFSYSALSLANAAYQEAEADCWINLLKQNTLQIMTGKEGKEEKEEDGVNNS